jgi:hypothetical protein
MAKHDVSFSIPERSLGKADVEFVVKADGAVFGTLAVSNGTLVWFPEGDYLWFEDGLEKIRGLNEGRSYSVRETLVPNSHWPA